MEPWILAHARLRPSDLALKILLSADRLLRSGVTSLVEVMSGGGSAKAFDTRLRAGLAAYHQAGLRVAFAAGISDKSHLVHGRGQDEAFLATLPLPLRDQARGQLPGADQLTRAVYFAVMDQAWQAYRDHPLIDVWFGPPGPQWVSDPFLREIAAQAAVRDVGIQIHLGESFYEKLHGVRDYGQPTLCHVDGTSLNGDEDIFAEMRLALHLARTPRLEGPARAPAWVFEMATSGGAKLLRQEHRLGRLAPGYQADIMLLDLERLTWPRGRARSLPARADSPARPSPQRDHGSGGPGSRSRTVCPPLSIPWPQARPWPTSWKPNRLATRPPIWSPRCPPNLEAYYQGRDLPELAPRIAYNSKR